MKLDGRETVQYVVGQMLDPVVREEVVNTCLIVHDENGRKLPPDAKGTLKCPALGTMEYENGTARPLPTPAQKRTLSDIQTEQLLWSERNFGNHPAWHPLLGIQEEAGELAHAFRLYGEERQSGRVATAILRRRESQPFSRTLDLAEVVEKALGGRRGAPIHPATRVFQALRIVVNEELAELEAGLAAAERVLAAGGRLAVVTFHSLEDRIVKAFLTERTGNAPGGSRHMPAAVDTRPPTFGLLFKGAREAGEAERLANPRARSARLRAAVRTEAPAWSVAA